MQRGVPAQVGELIACNPALYYLGAIVHDIGFYDLSKPSEGNIRRFGHLSVEKYKALFYPKPLNLSFFDSSLDWLHPVTGEPHEMTLEELYDVSVEKVITLFELLNTQSIE